MTVAGKNKVSKADSSVFLSPAKINLSLQITAKRPDGYHDIHSLMQPVSLYDEVELKLTQGRGVEVCADVVGVPNGKENIAYRAAELFFKETRYKSGVDISIKKRVPHGAGLGGGSSNAATVLMGLNALTGVGLEAQKLISLGAALGSDVPFFILKSSAIATGTGTELKAVKLPSYQYVLIKPDFNISTEWAYSNFSLTNRVEDNIVPYSNAMLNDVRLLSCRMINDLEPVTASRYPQILEIKEALVGAGAEGALMSGSGSTVFGLFSGVGAAKKAAVSLKSGLSGGYTIFQVSGL